MSIKLKLLPPFIMLLAGACTSIMTFIFDYNTNTGLWILVGVLVVFYILGVVLQRIILRFENQVAESEAKKQQEEEGKIVEKDNVTDGDSEESTDNDDDTAVEGEEGKK